MREIGPGGRGIYMFPRRWQKESDAWRNQRSRSDPMRCRQQNRQTTGGLAWIGSVVAKGLSHPIVVVSSNRSMKRRLVNDTSSSMLLSRACDVARDGTFDETREDGSFAETPDARVGTTDFRLGPSIPRRRYLLARVSATDHPSSNLPLTADYHTLHLLSTVQRDCVVAERNGPAHPSPRQGLTEAHMKPTWRFGLAWRRAATSDRSGKRSSNDRSHLIVSVNQSLNR